MTLHHRRIVQTLEQVLTAWFGGDPLDYQPLDEQALNGEPRPRRPVHPALAEIDPASVLDAFPSGIGEGSGVELVMSAQLMPAGRGRVERGVPFSTATGKMLHLPRVAANPTVAEAAIG